MRPTSIVWFCLLTASRAGAEAFRVCPDGSGDFQTIQAAVDQAAQCSFDPCDTVFVCPGSYPEDIVLEGKRVHIISEGGPSVTNVRSLSLRTGDSAYAGGTFDGMTILGSATHSIEGLTTAPYFVMRNCVVEGPLDFQTAGVNSPEFGEPDLLFAACEFRGSVRFRELGNLWSGLLVDRCTFTGSDLVADRVEYPFIVNSRFIGCGIDVIDGDSFEIRGNYLFEGGIRCTVSDGGADIRANYVADAAVGIAMTGMFPSGLRAEGNFVTGCDVGIDSNLGFVSLTNNRISQCGVGVRARTDGAPSPRGFAATGNVVWACGDGFHVGDSMWSLDIHGNTIARCDGDGLWLEYSDLGELSANIVAECGTGITIDAQIDTTELALRCNDVWGNPAGDWRGIGDLAGVALNFSADPLFCDPAGEDFALAVNSPCLPGNHPTGGDCGLVGAQGLGCASTSVDGGTAGEGPPPLWIGPNPFSDATKLEVGTNHGKDATLIVYDVAGRAIRRLWLDPTGSAAVWDGRGDSGSRVPPGVYFVRLRTSAGVTTARVAVLR